MFDKTQRGGVGLPVAIIVAGIIIAGTLMFVGRSGTPNLAGNGHNIPSGSSNFREIGRRDHVRGNPDAPITLVEYSDFQCPYCGALHPTLTQLTEESTDVRWVFRHFPLTNIHSSAFGAAVASECIAELAGNDAFWEFSDTLFSNQRQLGTTLYESEAAKFGINKDDYNACTSRDDIIDIVRTDFNEARSEGGGGTPFTVVISASGLRQGLPGPHPIEDWRNIVKQALEN